MMLFSRITKVAAVTMLAGLTLGLAACGSSAANEGDASGNTSQNVNVADPTLAKVPDAADLVPDGIAESGVLTVAIPTNEPPTQFYREGTKEMTGINPDVARLVAGALGLEIKIEVANFDSIIPGIEAGRYDMTVSGSSLICVG